MDFRNLHSKLWHSTRITAGTGAGCLAFIRVMSTTLVSTHRVPRIVRIPNGSPPRTFPRITATTGFTYA